MGSSRSLKCILTLRLRNGIRKPISVNGRNEVSRGIVACQTQFKRDFCHSRRRIKHTSAFACNSLYPVNVITRMRTDVGMRARVREKNDAPKAREKERGGG